MTETGDKLSLGAAGLACLAVIGLSGCAEDEPEPTVELRYSVEYPAVGYVSAVPDAAAARLAERVADGDVELGFDGSTGYLGAVLEELGIDASSQVLVFSRTSLQTRHILPSSPRAIYFNDESYVAFVPAAPTLEIASYSANLGPVFHTLRQDASLEPAMEREYGVCLRCHDTYGLTGGGVPRFLLGSGYTGTDGELVSHEAWILTGQGTPLRSRWGGWYVTGRHGNQVHLGNMIVERAEDLQDIEALRVGNIDSLTGLLDTSGYLTAYSDIVALMVLEHQIAVQNRISRLRFESAGASGETVAEHVDALLEEMLMFEAIALTDRIEGTSGFAEHFAALGPFDSRGRSLRQFDLETRLFRYPLSYLVYSNGFQSLPQSVKAQFYAGLRELLAGAPAPVSGEILAPVDRTAIGAILRETLPEAFEP